MDLLPVGEVSNSATIREPPLIYEEIGEPATSFTYTHNILYGASTGVAVSRPEEDDDVNLKLADTPSVGSYQMRQCPAYDMEHSNNSSCTTIILTV